MNQKHVFPNVYTPCLVLITFLFFLLFFSVRSHLFVIFALLLLQLPPFGHSDQPLGNIAAIPSPLPAIRGACLRFHREKSTAVSSVVDSRPIVRTHAKSAFCKQKFVCTRKKAHSVALELAKSALYLVVTRLNHYYRGS